MQVLHFHSHLMRRRVKYRFGSCAKNTLILALHTLPADLHVRTDLVTVRPSLHHSGQRDKLVKLEQARCQETSSQKPHKRPLVRAAIWSRSACAGRGLQAPTRRWRRGTLSASVLMMARYNRRPCSKWPKRLRAWKRQSETQTPSPLENNHSFSSRIPWTRPEVPMLFEGSQLITVSSFQLSCSAKSAPSRFGATSFVSTG